MRRLGGDRALAIARKETRELLRDPAYLGLAVVVPLLVFGPGVRPVSLGERSTFADAGQTSAEVLGVGPLATGTSFLAEVWGG